MAKIQNVIEISIDNPGNRELYFVPLSRTVRGRVVVERIQHKNRFDVMKNWGGIPEFEGQILGVNIDTGDGYLREPLHDNPRFMAQLKLHNQKLGEPVTTWPGVNMQEWMFWMRQAVAKGGAKIIAGSFPVITYSPPDANRPAGAKEKQRDALLTLLLGKLSPEERAQLTALNT